MDFSIDSSSRVVYSFGDCIFAAMLDLLPSAKWIDIATYNISKDDLTLHQLLANECAGITVRFITKIPSWFESYYKPVYAANFKKLFDLYHRRLDPKLYKCKLEPFFNVHNHSKLIITDQAAYIGSANFSPESSQNYECGVIYRNPDAIALIRRNVFGNLLRQSFPRDVSAIGKTKLYFQQFMSGIPKLFEPFEDDCSRCAMTTSAAPVRA
jgi:phosphatidylserine/phosphatidylglycerophosphate/cardiolipin synthase-like enzyme